MAAQDEAKRYAYIGCLRRLGLIKKELKIGFRGSFAVVGSPGPRKYWLRQASFLRGKGPSSIRIRIPRKGQCTSYIFLFTILNELEPRRQDVVAEEREDDDKSDYHGDGKL